MQELLKEIRRTWGKAPPPCGGCGKECQRAGVCANCLQVIYCQASCQLGHWLTHQLTCIGNSPPSSPRPTRKRERQEGEEGKPAIDFFDPEFRDVLVNLIPTWLNTEDVLKLSILNRELLQRMRTLFLSRFTFVIPEKVTPEQLEERAGIVPFLTNVVLSDVHVLPWLSARGFVGTNLRLRPSESQPIYSDQIPLTVETLEVMPIWRGHRLVVFNGRLPSALHTLRLTHSVMVVPAYGVFPAGLQKLFGTEVSGPIDWDTFPRNLTELSLTTSAKAAPLTNLPQGLLKLHFEGPWHGPVQHLPPGLLELIASHHTLGQSLQIQALPRTLRVLVHVLPSNEVQTAEDWPPDLWKLHIWNLQNIRALPPHLRWLKVASNDENRELELPPTLLGATNVFFNRPLKNNMLPARLRVLALSASYDQPILSLNEGLLLLDIENHNYEHAGSLVLPASLRVLAVPNKMVMDFPLAVQERIRRGELEFMTHFPYVAMTDVWERGEEE
jgi:hypothetical protein